VIAWKKKLGSRTPFVIFQFLVVRHNEHELGEITRLAHEMGVDAIRFKTAQVYDYANDPNQLIPSQEKYSRYKKGRDGSFLLKNALSNHCWRLWQGTVITWDGAVVPCCFDKDASHRMGNLGEKKFRDIWRDKEYVKFRSTILQGRRNIEICANCSEGTRVWA
jgi:radical SAM protein with 4Fe4S-binding SPASM domain